MFLLVYGGLKLRERPLLAHSNSQEGKKGKQEVERLMGIKSKEWPEGSQSHIKKAEWELGFSTCDKQQNVSPRSSC